MNRDENHELAYRIAKSSIWGFDQALEALEAGGEEREKALLVLHRSERTQKVLENIRETRRNLRRRRLGLL
jgi:hypothetical protein